MIQLRDGTTTHDPRLDRLEATDPRSADYPAGALLARAVSKTPRSQRWKLDTYLDQGHEGACVGFGITHGLLARPKPIRGLDATFAQEQLYWGAQRIDQWPGGDYPGADPHMDGTSVLAGLKTAKSLGYIGSYYWCDGLDEVISALGNVGPVVLGVRWLEGMFRPDADGYIHATGDVRGGHCILATGVALARRRVRLHNSWGVDWGMGGDAYLSFDDLAALLDRGGDAAILEAKSKS